MDKYVLTVALNAAVDVAYTVPGFGLDRINVAAEARKVAGGKANNVARLLARLGQRVVATGFAGGSTGRFIQEDLARCGVATDYEEVKGESRTCMVMLDPQGRTLTELREKGPTLSAADADRMLARFERLVQGASLVVLSGSLPPGIEERYYGALVALARERGVRSVLDASGTAFREGLAARPYLVKPNRDELEEWVGEPVRSEGEVLAAARRLLELGVENVAVSLGADGMVLVTPGGAWSATPPAIEAVNAVGSGDAAVAGLVAALRQGLTMDEMLRLGVACGTANALTSGVAEVLLEDLAELLDGVRVRGGR